jgi:hypothetical protein
MFKLSETLTQFRDSVCKKETIILNASGIWEVNRPNGIKQLLHLFKNHQIDLYHHFILALDNLEQYPVRFDTDTGGAAAQLQDFKGYLKAGEAILNHIPSDPNLKAELKRRLIGLKYRLEGVNGGIDPSMMHPLLKELCEAAADWKKHQVVFWDKELNDGDRLRLMECARYTLFVELILNEKGLRDHFFKWILRDGVFPQVYVEFPGMQRKIYRAHLSGRIGRIGGHYLQIQKTPIAKNEYHLEKIVTLPFEGVEKNILKDDLVIEFSGGYRLSIKEIFDVFKDKDKENGNLEFMALGIMNWNTHCWGWYNADANEYRVINLSEEDWWNELPVFEILTRAEAERRYGVAINGQNWLLMAKASRQYNSLSFMKTHAYLEVVVPTGGGGYSIYDFGKVVMRLPRSSLEELTIFGRSIDATICYPDDSVFYTHRQHCGFLFELTPHEGMKFMNSIRTDMKKVREGHVVYQMETENCGRWIQDHLEDHLGERVPNLFKVNVIHSTPNGILGHIFNWARLLPQKWQARAVILPQFFAGAWKGKWVEEKKGEKVWKSLTTSSFWKDGITHLPSFLHSHVESELLPVKKLPPTPHVIEARIEKRTLRKNLNDPFNLLDVFEDEKK